MNYLKFLFGLITKEEYLYRKIRKQSIAQWLKDYGRKNG